MIGDNIKSEILDPKSQREQSIDLKRRIRDFQQITDVQHISVVLLKSLYNQAEKNPSIRSPNFTETRHKV